MKKPFNLSNKVHIKLKEKVKINSGREKGKVGVVKKIIKKKNQVIVEGINIRSKHAKMSQFNESYIIKKFEFPIHSSNVSKYEDQF